MVSELDLVKQALLEMDKYLSYTHPGETPGVIEPRDLPSSCDIIFSSSLTAARCLVGGKRLD